MNIKEQDKKVNFINKIDDSIKNKLKSSEPSLFDEYCVESFNNYIMIADELQYRIDVNDLTFEEADLINDIAYNRYVIEVSQVEQLMRAGVPENSHLMKRYKATYLDKMNFEDRDISELPNKKALKKPEQVKRDIITAKYLYGIGKNSQSCRSGIRDGCTTGRGETEYVRGGAANSNKSSYNEDTPSMKKAEMLLSKYGSTSQQPITADSTRKKKSSSRCFN